jgi:hypothetical protein
MANGWRVVNQRQYEELTSAGTFVSTVEVTFELNGSGTVASVKIPQRLYSEEYVRAEIDRVASTMAAVENL